MSLSVFTAIVITMVMMMKHLWPYHHALYEFSIGLTTRGVSSVVMEYTIYAIMELTRS